jgi:hypothetical protein
MDAPQNRGVSQKRGVSAEIRTRAVPLPQLCEIGGQFI